MPRFPRKHHAVLRPVPNYNQRIEDLSDLVVSKNLSSLSRGTEDLPLRTDHSYHSNPPKLVIVYENIFVGEYEIWED